MASLSFHGVGFAAALIAFGCLWWRVLLAKVVSIASNDDVTNFGVTNFVMMSHLEVSASQAEASASFSEASAFLSEDATRE